MLELYSQLLSHLNAEENDMALEFEAKLIELLSQQDQLNEDSQFLQCLKNAGVDLQQVPVIKLLTISTYADIASFAAHAIEQTGLKVQVEIIQKSLLLQQTAQQQALFFRASWIADYPDAENYMAQYYSKNPSPPNYTRYSNPLFDALYEKALGETNDSIRYAAYRAMDQLVINDAPVVPIWYDEVIHLVQPGITGFYPTSMNMLELKTTDLPATK